MGNQSWYSNKELFEMIDSFKNEISDLRVEMQETKTLIRDYNGLRKNITSNSRKVNEIERELKVLTSSKHEYIGYILATISTLFLLLNYLK